VLIHAAEMEKIKKRLNDIIVLHTGQALQKVEVDTDRDFFMDAEEAKAYGLVDEILRAARTPEEPT